MYTQLGICDSAVPTLPPVDAEECYEEDRDAPLCTVGSEL